MLSTLRQQQLTIFVLLFFIVDVDIQANSYGGHNVVIVAFDASYTLSQFVTTLTDFANAFDCPDYTTMFYFDERIQLSCFKRQNLTECLLNYFRNGSNLANVYYVSS